MYSTEWKKMWTNDSKYPKTNSLQTTKTWEHFGVFKMHCAEEKGGWGGVGGIQSWADPEGQRQGETKSDQTNTNSNVWNFRKEKKKHHRVEACKEVYNWILTSSCQPQRLISGWRSDVKFYNKREAREVCKLFCSFLEMRPLNRRK